MKQQWDCHVVGNHLSGGVGSLKIDLETWRKDNPNWRSSVIPAIKKAITKGDKRAIYAASNW